MRNEMGSNLEREIRMYINSKLSNIKLARHGTLIRFLYTEKPYPTVSINVYRSGRKIIEIPVYNLDKFVDTLNEVRVFLKLPIGKQVEQVEKSEEENEYYILGSVEFDVESELQKTETSKPTSKSNSKSYQTRGKKIKGKKTFDKNDVLNRLKDKR